MMKEQYVAPEVEVVKFHTEDMILMSTTGDNNGEVEGGDEDLGRIF